MKYRLLGSSPDLERLEKMVRDYFFGGSLRFHENEATGEIEVVGRNGAKPGYRIVRKGGRYRFEAEAD